MIRLMRFIAILVCIICFSCMTALYYQKGEWSIDYVDYALPYIVAIGLMFVMRTSVYCTINFVGTIMLFGVAIQSYGDMAALSSVGMAAHLLSVEPLQTVAGHQMMVVIIMSIITVADWYESRSRRRTLSQQNAPTAQFSATCAHCGLRIDLSGCMVGDVVKCQCGSLVDIDELKKVVDLSEDALPRNAQQMIDPHINAEMRGPPQLDNSSRRVNILLPIMIAIVVMIAVGIWINTLAKKAPERNPIYRTQIGVVTSKTVPEKQTYPNKYQSPPANPLTDRRLALEQDLRSGKLAFGDACELATIYLRLGMEPQFVSLTRGLVDSPSLPPEASLSVARLYEANKRWDLCIYALQKYLIREPNAYKVWIDLAYFQFLNKKPQEAFYSLKKSVAAGGDIARSLLLADQRFAPLRTSLEFKALVDQVSESEKIVSDNYSKNSRVIEPSTNNLLMSWSSAFLTKLRVNEIKSTPYLINFIKVSHARERYVFQIQMRDNDRTYFKSIGETADRFKLVAYDENALDGPTLVLECNGMQLRVIKGRKMPVDDYEISMEFLMGRKLFVVHSGCDFEYKGASFNVAQVDISRTRVLLHDYSRKIDVWIDKNEGNKN